MVALVAGFVLMVFELAGARVLAPWIGSSTYVWTSVIGVIIAALSIGYWVGGKVADKRGYPIDVVRLALLSALMITFTMAQYNKTLLWVSETFEDSRLQGVVASLLLFAPASFLLGMISPYLAKLNVKSLTTTGRAVASLSALNSIGGILGTFVAGFILFGYIGSHETLALTAVAMMMVSWLLVPTVQRRRRLVVSTGIVFVALLSVPTSNPLPIDTPSARYMIYDLTSGERYLATGPEAAQSGIITDQPDKLLFWYTQRLAEVAAAAPNHDDILVLGGGAFTLPRYLAETYPEATIDVVEIDPELATIAREHFNYDDPPNVNLIFMDARTYLNQTDRHYDIVIVDVYGDTQVPFTLLTREYGAHVARVTKPHGVVASNVLGGMAGNCKELLQALDAPYRAHFAHVAYRMERPEDSRSNLVVAYSRDKLRWTDSHPLKLSPREAYTDNFVPAERLQHDCKRADVT